MTIDSKEAAIAVFRQLVARYGLQWTAQVPKQAHDQLRECNRFLNGPDKRQALGLPV